MPPGSGDHASEKGAVLVAGDLVAGHYRVERVIGSGGMGVVVAARDERTGEAVAVKLLRSVDDTRAVERFFREARAMGRLASDHVVRVRDAGSDGKKPYLVMDRLHGMDLSARAKQRGPLPVQEAADYLIQACEALSHAHSKGIVHRDVKPSNLFLHVEGGRTILKVLDFGISKVQTRDVWERTLTTTDDGGVLGSPPYMSPEQVRDPKAVDPRSDVWSLGVVLYKILSGSVPYDGESVGEVFAKVLERPYPSLRVTTDVPAEVDAIVERCLTKHRDARWPHVGELALALAPFASPAHAAIAPSIAQRMHDEGPTLERAPSRPEPLPAASRERGEPATMSLAGPVPEARGSSPVSVPPPAQGSVAAPGRMRVALVLGLVGIAAGMGIGLVAMRGGASAATQPPGESTSMSPSALGTGATGPTSGATAAVSVVASGAPAASASASATGKAGRPHIAGARKPPASGGGGAGTAAAPATTVRPELQPSPYPTAP